MSKFYDAKEDERKSDSSATAPIMPEATTEATEEEIFRRLGSPENHLARSVTGKLESSYYADDQNDFACLSQEILISLIKNNNLRDILKLNQSGVDADEKAGMEAMYKAQESLNLQKFRKMLRKLGFKNLIYRDYLIVHQARCRALKLRFVRRTENIVNIYLY